MAPTSTRRVPIGDTCMMIDPALWTRERKRVSRPLATSYRRRSVRSRRHNRTTLSPNQCTVVPDDLDQAPAARRPDPHLDRRADLLALNGRSERSTSSWSSGCTRSRPDWPTPVGQRPLEDALGRSVPPHDGAGGVDQDDGVGKLHERLDHRACLVGQLVLGGRAGGLSLAGRGSPAVGPRCAQGAPNAALAMLAPLRTVRRIKRSVSISANRGCGLVAIGLRTGTGTTAVYRLRPSRPGGPRRPIPRRRAHGDAWPGGCEPPCFPDLRRLASRPVAARDPGRGC